MGNWTYVFPYNTEYAGWLEEQGLAHPVAAGGSRLPTRLELEAAVRKLFLAPYEVLVELSEASLGPGPPEQVLRIRGQTKEEFRLIVELAKICGQLWYYPDSGASAVVLDEHSPAEYWAEVYGRFEELEDQWERIHAAFYGRVARRP